MTRRQFRNLLLYIAAYYAGEYVVGPILVLLM